MTSASRPSRLAELASPTRGRARYAPLTAGLLARKGEAAPATPFFTLDTIGPHGGPAGARILLPGHEHTEPEFFPSVETPTHEAGSAWRAPHSALHGIAPELAHEPLAPDPDLAISRQAAPEPMRAAFTVELDLDILARLVIEARRRSAAPGRVIEQALNAQLAALGPDGRLCDSERLSR